MSEQLTLPDTYDPRFKTLMERLRQKYPPELFSLSGIHPDQLNIDLMSKAFFKNRSENSATADVSIDPNANVTGRDCITYNYELPKAALRLNSLYNLWKQLEAEVGKRLADKAIEGDLAGYIYINDSWDLGRPYCFNYSALDVALEGLKMGGRLRIDPPKSLDSFLRQMEQFTVYAANSTLGACGFADLLLVASRYVERIKLTGMDHKVKVFDHDYTFGDGDPEWRRLKTYVKEKLISFIYTLNWEFRGNQSPFTNISVYDRPFLDKLLPAYAIQGKAPNVHVVEMVQSWFLEAFNETLARTPVTFPVVTACFSVTQDEEGGRRLADQAFLIKIAEANKAFGFINIYCGESSTLSSCCRLRSSISDLGYSNTFGSGSTKIGSLGVVTLNLPRAAREANKTRPDSREAAFEAFLENVKVATHLAGFINHAKRRFIKDRIRRGSLPLYSLGIMDLDRQYSTCGFTGLYEALEILGQDMRTDKGLELASDVLCKINDVNAALSKLLGEPCNMEQVPGESSAVKLARKDAVLGLNPEGYELYSNQFIPLWEEGTDLLDRIRAQGRLDKFCTGGAILHLNVGNPIEDDKTMQALIAHACAAGVVYFAVNYAINRCENGHMSVGRDPAQCPQCGAGITDTFTRVVGFLTNVKGWHKTRREHDWPKRVFAAPKGAAS